MKILRKLFRAATFIGVGVLGASQLSAQDFATTPDFLTNILLNDTLGAVSYTHLDVYKRQV